VSQSTALTYNNTITVNGNSIALTGFADVDPRTGELKAAGTYTSSTPLAFSQYNVVASLIDTFTISASGLDGTLGYLALPFTITGTTSPSGLGELSAFSLDGGVFTLAECTNTNRCFFPGDVTTVAGPLPFHYGTPFTLSWGLGAITFPGSG